MIRRDDGYDRYLLTSEERVTQGDPLSMVLYGIGMLILTRNLKDAVLERIQPWYADVVGAGGEFDDIE